MQTIQLIKNANGVLEAKKVTSVNKVTNRRYLKAYINSTTWGDKAIGAAQNLLNEIERDWREQYSRLAVELCEGGYTLKSEDFAHYNDKNNITQRMAKKWFDKNALPLDIQCMELSEIMGVEITPENYCQIIIQYQDKYLHRRSADLIEAEEYFSKVTALPSTKAYATELLSTNKTLTEAVELDCPF